MTDWHANAYGPPRDLTPLGIAVCLFAFVLLFWVYVYLVDGIDDPAGSYRPEDLSPSERLVPKTSL